jgi:hypothetical protein
MSLKKEIKMKIVSAKYHRLYASHTYTHRQELSIVAEKLARNTISKWRESQVVQVDK